MKEATHLREAPKDAPDEVKRAYEILEKHTWTREELLAYEKAKIALMDDLDAIRTAREEEKREIARKMLGNPKLGIQDIIDMTGLSKEDIDQIKALT